MSVWIIPGVMLTIVVAAIIASAIQAPKRRREAEERDRRRSEEVERRRWKLEVERAPRGLVYRYSGSSDGIAWTCETKSWSVGRTSNSQHRVLTRWSTDDTRTREGILAIWPSFGASPQQSSLEVPQFVLNLMLTPLINALGEDAPEAAQLSTATAVVPEDPRLRDHYLLRATNPEAMQRFLGRGAGSLLADAASWLPSRSSDHHLIIAVISERGFAVLLRGWVDDVAHIARIAELGSALAKAQRGTDSASTPA